MYLKFSLIFILLLNLKFIESLTPDEIDKIREELRKCQRIKIPRCMDFRDIGYNITKFPNYFNHQTQFEAEIELETFSPLIASGCSPDMLRFLCFLYAPECNIHAGVIPPCRSLCLSVKSGCEPILNTNGFSWPEKLNCSTFPEDELCVGEINESVSFTNEITTTTKAPLPVNQCQPIEVPLCKGLSYNMTRFPNILGHENQVDAGLEVSQYFPFVEAQCSAFLQEFLCSAYVPECNENQADIIPPSRSLCEKSKSSCESLMTRYSFQWPSELDCERFPSESVLDIVEVSALPISPNVMNVSWILSSATNNISKYEVSFSDDDGMHWDNLETNNTWISLQNLQAYHEYSIRVTAYSGLDRGEPSNITHARTLEDVPGAPPQNFTLIAIDIFMQRRYNLSRYKNALASWDPPPPNLQNGVIQGYKIQYKRTTERERDIRITNETSMAISLLTGHESMVRVRAYTTAGNGPFTPWKTVFTPKYCDDGWISVGRYCFYVSRDKLNWVESHFTCSFILRSNFVEIDSLEKNNEVKKIAMGSGKGNFWIGVTDIKVDGTYTIPYGKKSLNFTDWASASPDVNDEENCVQLRKRDRYRWNVTKCSKLNYFICEGN